MVQQCSCQLHPDQDTAPGECSSWTQECPKPPSRDHCRGNTLVDFSDCSANLDDDKEEHKVKEEITEGVQRDEIRNRGMILVNIFLSSLLFTMFLGAWLLGT